MNKVKISILYLLLFTIFSFFYKKFIFIYFEYMGFNIEFSIEKFILSILTLVILPLFFNFKYEVYFSLVNAYLVFSVIPMLVLFSFQDLPYIYFFYLIIGTLILIFSYKLPSIKFLIKFGFKKFLYTFIFLILLVLLILAIKNHQYFNLNLLKVYEFREIISKRTPQIIVYLYNIVFKGIYPIIFLYILFHYRNLKLKLILILISIMIYTLIFGLTSHKTFFFIIPILTILYVFTTSTKNLIYLYTKLVLFILISLLIVNYILQDLGLILSSLFIRRLFFIPAHLNFVYFEFFQKHPYILFTDSNFLPFKYILGYPYNIDLSHLIGKEVFGKVEMAANTGWIGSGFAQAGIIGIIIYAIIISLILKYLTYLSKYLYKGFIVTSFFPYIFIMFLSSDLKTTLLTHGLILYLILLSMIASYEKRRRFTIGYKALSHYNSPSKV